MKLQKRMYWLIPIIIILLAVTVPLLPRYNIKTINVETNVPELAAEIAGATELEVGANIFWTLLEKGNIFNMRFTGAEQLLREKYIRYGDVKVQAVLPSEVLVQYTVKEPVFEVRYGDIYLVTDIKGCVLDSRKEHELGFVRITGLDVTGFSLGCIVGGNSDKFEYVEQIYRALESYDITELTAFREYIDWIDVSSPTGVAMMYDKRILVKLDIRGDMTYQTSYMCKAIASDVIKYSERGTLDFTVGEAPVFSAE